MSFTPVDMGHNSSPCSQSSVSHLQPLIFCCPWGKAFPEDDARELPGGESASVAPSSGYRETLSLKPSLKLRGEMLDSCDKLSWVPAQGYV